MQTSEQWISTHVLVIGTGGSGLRAAIELDERDIDVLALGKRPKADAHTSLAAGGPHRRGGRRGHTRNTSKHPYARHPLLGTPETKSMNS